MSVFEHIIILCFSLMIPWTHSTLFQIMNSPISHPDMKSMLIERCVLEKSNPIIISSDLRDIINGSSIEGTIPIILIDTTVEIANNSAMFLPKLPTYVLSTTKIQEVLKKIKFSSWWNIKSRFFIVELNKKCDNVWDVLQFIWKMNLLSSLFVCQEIDGSVGLHTYNPYANYAPYPWQHVKSTFNESGQQWTLMKRLDSKGQYGCDNLFFDKTKQLNGSEVVAGTIANSKVLTEYGKAYNVSSMKDKLPITASKLFEEIFSFLNVISVIYYIDLNNPQNITNQTLEGIFQNLADSTYDISLTCITILGRSHSFDFLYPRGTGPYLILTRPYKVASFLKQLGSIFGIETIFFTALIFVIMLIVLLVCKRPQFGSALLELLRLILSTSTILKFYRDSLRIFVLSVLIFVIFMNNIYQGQMSAYSTKSNREVIDSITDLQNLNYNIYMHQYGGKILGVDDWSNAQKKYVQFTDYKCIEYVVNSTDYRTACIFAARYVIPEAVKYNLHVSLVNISKFTSFFIRNDWPLKTRFDSIMSRFSESGFLHLWDNIEVNDPLKRLKLRKIPRFNGYREVVLSDLYYIFLFLGISLSISLVVFIIEIWM